MGPFTLVMLALIVIGLPVGLGILSDVYKRRLAFRERELELQAQIAAGRHNNELEQRVRVLEKIITDRGVETAAQIEALRQPRLTREEDRA